MGARLRYAKVIDREKFFHQGGKVHPGLENEVLLNDEPGTAGAFLLLRGWDSDRGTVTEQWRLETPDGRRVYESLPREVHLPTHSHVERLEDEVADLDFEFAADDYTIVFSLDERDVARVQFAVRLSGEARTPGALQS